MSTNDLILKNLFILLNIKLVVNTKKLFIKNFISLNIKIVLNTKGPFH